MNFVDLFSISTESLTRTKSRSLLTVLGIVIGIGSVILMLSIGRGAEGLILSQVADIGSDLVFVEPASGDPAAGPPSPFIEQTVNLDDAKAIEESGLFEYVTPSLFSTLTVNYADYSEFLQVYGTDEEELSMFPTDMRYGEFLNENHIDTHARVAVLGLGAAKEMFGDQNPVGEKIKLKQKSFRVIGVFEEQGSRFFQNLDDRITIPVTTMRRDILGVDYVNFITMRIQSGADIDETKEELRWLMRDLHNIQNPEGLAAKDDFFVSSQTDATEVVGVIGSVLTILLSSIAAISLIVGGIGIMNIMLVSVSERTREIGLRKAVGATYREILQQFLLEAILLTMFGGLMGMIFGSLLSWGSGTIVKNYFLDDWVVVVPVEAVILAVAVSSLVGIIFGIYPARSAAKLNPIDALRYE